MIPLNQEQYLGRKAYMLMVSRRMTAGMVIVLISILMLILKSGLTGFVAGLMSVGGTSGARAIASASIIMNGVVLTGIIIGLVACIFGILMARMEYKNYTFTFEEFDLRLKRGIVSTKVVSIPYRQMQDINLERDILHRMTGTTRVIIDSAGTEGKDENGEAEIVLEPIDEPVAEEIRLMLQRKIGVQVVQTEKQADHQAGIQEQAAQTPETGDNSIVS